MNYESFITQYKIHSEIVKTREIVNLYEYVVTLTL